MINKYNKGLPESSSWLGTIIWSTLYITIAVYGFGGGIFEQVCAIGFIGWSVYLIYHQCELPTTQSYGLPEIYSRTLSTSSEISKFTLGLIFPPCS